MFTAGATEKGSLLFAKYYESVILYGILAEDGTLRLIVGGCLHKRNHIVITALFDAKCTLYSSPDPTLCFVIDIPKLF